MDSVIFEGKSLALTLPSGKKITIRETNGDDDAILSRIGNAIDGSSVKKFLNSIVTLDQDLQARPMIPDLMKWKCNDLYYTLFKQRLFNIGTELQFTNKCSNIQCKDKPISTYDEDLTQFDQELPASTRTNNDQIISYPLGKDEVVEKQLSSGKKIRFHILTGELEEKSLQTLNEDRSSNTGLLDRELAWYTNGQWVVQKNFQAFSTKEMVELRKYVNSLDDLFDPMIEFSCPYCKMTYRNKLLGMPVFFSPELGM